MLLDLYDEQATTECHCERISLPFSVNDAALTADGVRLDYQDYEGKPLQMDLRFSPSGKIVHTTWRGSPFEIFARAHGHRLMSRSKRFYDPIILPDGRKLLTMRDATDTSPRYRRPSMTLPNGRTRWKPCCWSSSMTNQPWSRGWR